MTVCGEGFDWAVRLKFFLPLYIPNYSDLYLDAAAVEKARSSV